MKTNLSLRAIVILLFIFLYLGSLFVLNLFYNNQQKEIDRAYQNFHIDQSLSELNFKTETDSLRAKELAVNIRESLMAIEMIRAETQAYSFLFLFLMMIVSIAAFILVFYKVTVPLKELQSATKKIKAGDFSVALPVKGLKEMRLLQQSFNDMSSELDTIQHKLLLAEKEMIWKELSRMLAHEIKNPLTPITLSVQRLEEKFDADLDKFMTIFPEAMMIINQEVNNLRDLVHSFSSFAKITAPEMRVFDPAAEIERIVKPYLQDYQITTELKSGFKVSFDKTHFYQIMTNILQNAVDAIPPAGKISISLETQAGQVCISIADNGSGITPDDLPRIFEPYFTRKKKGTGLGLAVVKKLADANRAEIKVDSKTGTGTRFTLILKEQK